MNSMADRIHDRLEAYPTATHDRLEAYPTVTIHNRLEAYPTAICLGVRRMVGLAALVAIAGCQRGPETAPVTGTVTFLGKPLPLGAITFEPAQGRSAFGEIRDGQILDVVTFKPNDGVIVGHARVGIQATTNFGQPRGPHRPLIPSRYFDPGTSELTAEIQTGITNELRFDLQP